MSQRMPPVQYIMTGVSGAAPCSAAGSGAPFAPAGVSRNWSCTIKIAAETSRVFRFHLAAPYSAAGSGTPIAPAGASLNWSCRLGRGAICQRKLRLVCGAGELVPYMDALLATSSNPA